MPAKPAPTVKPRGLTLAASTVERQDAELTAAGRELAEDLVASPVDEFSSPAERRSGERTAVIVLRSLGPGSGSTPGR